MAEDASVPASLGKWLTADGKTYAVLKGRPRELRNNPSQAEAELWPHIRKRQIEGCEFRRQHIIGHFISDFVCLDKKLILEIDGGYHQLPEVKLKDEERTAILKQMGYQVLRFRNEDIYDDLESVLKQIRTALIQPLSSPPSREEGLGVEPNAWVPIIAKEGMNVPYLKEKLYEAVVSEKVNTDSTIVSNARHYEALEKSYEALDAVLQGMDNGITSDFIAMDIRRSLYHLGEITGEISTDELLGNIFGKFCIGK